MATPSRVSAQIIPFPSSRTRRFARKSSESAKRAREIIQEALEIMLNPKARSDRRPS